MTKKVIFILAFLIFLISCKKDKLTGDRAILEGNWEWVHSIKHNYSLLPPFLTSSQMIYPSSISTSYGLKFLKKGEVHLIENNETRDKYRTVFANFKNCTYCDGNGKYEFEIDINNGENYTMRGWVKSDTLVLYFDEFPLTNYSNSNFSVVHENFFKKVE